MICRLAAYERWLVLLAFLIAAVALTWPFALHPQSTITGAPGDLTGATGWVQLWVDNHIDPFLPGTMHAVNVPHGRPVQWALNDAAIGSVSIVYLLALAGGAIMSYGLLVVFGFALSAFSLYALSRHYGASLGAAVIAGAAFGFSPYMQLRTLSPELMANWIFVLLAWAFIRLTEAPSRRRGLLAGAAAAFAALWTPYFVLFSGVMFVFVLAAGAILWARRHELRRFLMPAALALLPFLGAGVYLRLLGQANIAASGQIDTLVGEVELNAARPYEYVVPSASNPLLGSAARSFRLHHLHGSGADLINSTIYVGIVLLIAAIVGAIVIWRRHIERPAVLAVALACIVGGFLVSLPPYIDIGGIRIMMLSGFIHDHVNPSWRIYSRLAIVVMLGLCLLAAFGLTYVTRSVRSVPLRGVVVALLALAILGDLWTRPNPATTRITVPRAYRMLARLPRGPVAEYPLRWASQSLDYWDVFYAHYTHDPIFGGYGPNTDDERAKMNFGKLDQTSAIGLASYGVRYAVVRPDAPYAPVQPGKAGPGFRPLLTGGKVDLYEVTATGYATTTFESGFYGAETYQGLPRRWMMSVGTLSIYNPNRTTMRFQFSGFAFSNAVARRISVLVGRRERASFKVATSDGPWSFSLTLPPGDTTVRLQSDPPAAMLGATDPRVASIYISDITSDPR